MANPFFDEEARDRAAELGDRCVVAVCAFVVAVFGPDWLSLIAMGTTLCPR